MCITAATAATLIGAGVSAATSIYTARQQAKAADSQAGAAAKSDAMAAQSSNARLAMRRRALAANSLVTGASDPTTGSGTGASGVMGGMGQQTLGG